MTTPRTWITLSRAAFDHNVSQIKQCIGSQELALVIKSNAYGHGLHEIAHYANHNATITWLCTAGIAEAVALRVSGITKNILALTYLEEKYEEALSHNIHCALHTYEDAVKLSQAAQRIGKLAFVHIEVDTGMSRLGCSPEDVISFIQSVKQLPGIIVYGIFTHLCDTSNPDQRYSQQQLELFDAVLDAVTQAGISIPCTHAQSSSALCIRPARSYTFVRAGAALYGLTKSLIHKQLVHAVYPHLELKPVLSWHTTIIGIKQLPQGVTIGYDRTHVTTRDTTIALLPLGYADGLPRTLSNKGVVRIGHHNAPIIGIISMNLTAIDITDIPDVLHGDEVSLIADVAPAYQLAQQAGVITNQLLAQLHQDIPRIMENIDQQKTVIPLKREKHPDTSI